VAHLADVEIIYGYRMRQMLADEKPQIAPVDQDNWARQPDYRTAPVIGSLEQYTALRRANLRLLRQPTSRTWRAAPSIPSAAAS